MYEIKEESVFDGKTEYRLIYRYNRNWLERLVFCPFGYISKGGHDAGYYNKEMAFVTEDLETIKRFKIYAEKKFKI